MLNLSMIYILTILAFAPHAYSKNLPVTKPAALSQIISTVNKISRIPQKYKEEKSAEISAELPSVSEDEVRNQDKIDGIDINSDRSILRTAFAWLTIVFAAILVMKILIWNFKIPFNYDPSFKSKNFSRQRQKIKKL